MNNWTSTIHSHPLEQIIVILQYYCRQNVGFQTYLTKAPYSITVMSGPIQPFPNLQGISIVLLLFADHLYIIIVCRPSFYYYCVQIIIVSAYIFVNLLKYADALYGCMAVWLYYSFCLPLLCLLNMDCINQILNVCISQRYTWLHIGIHGYKLCSAVGLPHFGGN